MDNQKENMKRLSDIPWHLKYSPEGGNLLEIFYLPALSRAVRYDRSTGYFKASALAAAAKGVEGLIRNKGRMRLIVGCTLEKPEADAIAAGQSVRDAVEDRLLAAPLSADDPKTVQALELLAWMVAKGLMDVKVAVPCDAGRKPITGQAIFHEKTGIIMDAVGDRIAFNGSVNESESGWTGNFDSFHVFTSWGPSADHLDAEETSFNRLWTDQAKTAIVIDVPTAVRDELLKFLPKDDQLPARLEIREPVAPYETDPSAEPPKPASDEISPPSDKTPPPSDIWKDVWAYILMAPAFPNGGERIGEATCPITPWPHQVRAFHRMYDNWPPRLLIADEVGLGKTIQAGMVLRQAWLAGRVKRILVLAPKAVLTQWQIELREKFNLNWPIYDGKKFSWYPSQGLVGNAVRAVERDQWHHEPCVLASSHLMRRRDRAQELLEAAKPWDLIVLDEAHHARRRGGSLGASDHSPNQLLRLMQGLRNRTKGLILLTATPMQVSPVEVWDLLNLFGLPPEWHADAFVRFFEYAAQHKPGHAEMDAMAAQFRSIESAFGEVSEESARKTLPELKKIKVRRILRTLRDTANTRRRMLENDERRAAVRLMKAHTPVKRLVSRHTRRLLRQYHKAGKLDARIAARNVQDQFVTMTKAEREVYDAVENYISSTYNNAASDKRTAIGFVMTVYRRRLASSFFALAHTLENRMNTVTGQYSVVPSDIDRLEEDVLEDELASEVMDAEEAADLEAQSLALEEQDDLEILLEMTRRLPTDTKTTVLLNVIKELQAKGYKQVMVFTQYTDTLDFLRTKAARRFGLEAILCFSGRGGEVPEPGGGWRRIDRDETKQRFQEGRAEVMLCTDAAAEGLNFQFCGALVNYDMPWNPMKVEQRIGRIDRLGQAFETIQIVNLHYEDTVETDVYNALKERIDLFTNFVGKLQPILARLPKAISDATLTRADDKDQARSALVSDIAAKAEALEDAGFDLDEAAAEDMTELDRLEALYGLPELHRILSSDNLLPPGIEAKPLGPRDFTYLAPGMKIPVRVTTDPDYFDAHPESVELWSPGGVMFPVPETPIDTAEADRASFLKAIKNPIARPLPP